MRKGIESRASGWIRIELKRVELRKRMELKVSGWIEGSFIHRRRSSSLEHFWRINFMAKIWGVLLIHVFFGGKHKLHEESKHPTLNKTNE